MRGKARDEEIAHRFLDCRAHPIAHLFVHLRERLADVVIVEMAHRPVREGRRGD
ncbi:MAG: hypothetical protein ACKO1O_00295 [Erythrobacter sp.]